MKVNINKIKPAAAGIIPAVVVATYVGISIGTYKPPTYEKISAADYTENNEPERTSEKTKNVSKVSLKKDDVPSVSKAEENATYKDGTYIGTGTGFGGELKVQVTIKDGKIADIKLLSHHDDTPYITNAQKLLQNIISLQSTNVDTVSGATYSSVGLINAVRDALSQAGGTEKKIETKTPEKSEPVAEVVDLSTVDEPSSYKDGIYQGSATGYGGITTVEVTITNGQIVDIKILSHHDDSPYINNASSLINTIINAQSTNVDAVSGATYSSAGIINAVRDALSKAGGKNENDLPQITTISTTATTKKTRSSSTEVSTVVPSSGYKYANGTFEGVGEGYKGDVTVSVTISDHKISAVNVLKNVDDPEYFSKAESLCDEIVKQQTSNIDTVSGATFSSCGILDAVDDALSKSIEQALAEQGETTAATPSTTTNITTTTTAKPPVTDTSEDIKLLNGIFTGTAVCYPDESEDFSDYDLTLKVTFENGKITKISDVAGGGDYYDVNNDWYVSRAEKGTSKIKGVVSQIILLQSTENIDAVSGATCSSDAIVKAVADAWQQAEAETELEK